MTSLPWWGWVLAVAAGALGALLRTALVRRFARHQLPLGVLAANVVASAVGGAMVGIREHLDPAWFFVLVGGFCGGLSTLSTLASDTVELWAARRRLHSIGNVAVNVAAGLVAAWAACRLVR